jgi:hypothetical protein
MLLILSPIHGIHTQSRIQKRSMFDFRDYFGSGSSPRPLRFRNLGSNLNFKKKACFCCMTPNNKRQMCGSGLYSYTRV